MKEVYCRYLVDAVKEVDIESVASALDLKVVRKGMYDFIRCPGHLNRSGRMDRNATNAKLCNNPKGYYCFACGEFVPMIDMVQEVLGCDFNSAVNFIGDNCGVAPKIEGDAPKRTALTIEERELLQLPNQSDNVKCLIDITTKEPLVKRGDTFIKKGNLYYVYAMKKGWSLNRLHNENKSFYSNLIKWTKIHRKNYYKKMATNIDKGYYDDVFASLFDDTDVAKSKLAEIYRQKFIATDVIEEI